MNSNILKVTKDDLNLILQLQKEAFYQVAVAENNFEIKPMVQTYQEICEDYEKKLFLKYIVDGEIVGSVRAFFDENTKCEIGRLIVKPKFQGKGIGSELMNAIESECADATVFSIFTSKSSESTIRLYKKLGYSIVRELSEDNIVMVIMEKKKLD